MTAFSDIARAAQPLILSGCPEGYESLIAADLARAEGLSVFIARDFARMNAIIEALKFFAPNLAILAFPAWDCLPYDRMSPTGGIVAQRMYALSQLAQMRKTAPKTPVLLLTTASAMAQKVPPLSVINEGHLSLKPGQTLDIADLDAYFVTHGYTRVSTVSERGEFAVRGGLLDVFSPSHDEPVRLDFFGDTLESIRSFDTETQRSLKQLTGLDFSAVSEIRMDEASIKRFRQHYLEAFGAAGDDPLYNALSSGIRRQGIEHLLPLFYDGLDSVFDYLPQQSLIMLDALADNAFAERQSTIEDAYQLRSDASAQKGGASYRALAPRTLYLDDAGWQAGLKPHRVRRFEPFEREGTAVVDMGGRLGRNFAEARLLDSTNLFTAVTDHAKALAKQGKRVIFASWTDGSSDRLGVMLSDHGLGALRLASDWADALAFGIQGTKVKPIQRAVLPLDHGFETESLAVISETDILGDRLARPRKRRRAQNFLAEASARAWHRPL